MPRKKTVANFETSLQSLEQIVTRMESETLSLEESLRIFEQGVKLANKCQQSLTEAEQKITLLSHQQADTPTSDTPDES